jgi:hypothetical protein
MYFVFEKFISELRKIEFGPGLVESIFLKLVLLKFLRVSIRLLIFFIYAMLAFVKDWKNTSNTLQ